MPKPVKLHPEDLEAHIEIHKEKKGLAVGWAAFCAMAGKAGVSSMARVFEVNYATMSHWLDLYKQLK